MSKQCKQLINQTDQNVMNYPTDLCDKTNSAQLWKAPARMLTLE